MTTPDIPCLDLAIEQITNSVRIYTGALEVVAEIESPDPALLTELLLGQRRVRFGELVGPMLRFERSGVSTERSAGIRLGAFLAPPGTAAIQAGPIN